jgi:septum formation protein
LLREIGAHFIVAATGVDERPRADASPEAYARRTAFEKARAGRRLHPASWILAADTVVELDGCLLGKPPDAAGARAMLARLSGRWHRVLTAVVLLSPDGVTHLDEIMATRVSFRPLSDEEIDAYVASGEPMDKAGAYAIQEGGGHFVRVVDGSYTCVVGLPLELVEPALRAAGLLASRDAAE